MGSGLCEIVQDLGALQYCSTDLYPSTPSQVCIILFQQLHYYDAASFVRWLTHGGSWWELKSVVVEQASDAWWVPLPAAGDLIPTHTSWLVETGVCSYKASIP